MTAEYLHVCHKSDPNLVGCIKQSIEIIRPYLVSGIPKLDIPPIEPMNVGDLLISEKTQSTGLRISAKEISAFGASNFVLKDLRWARGFPQFNHWEELNDWQIKSIFNLFVSVIDYGKHYTVEVAFPKLRVEGKYDVNGQILLLPVRGNGKFEGNFSDCTGNVRLQFDRKDNGVQIKKFQVKIKVGKGRLHLHNLFNGDKTLGELNWSSFSYFYLPVVVPRLNHCYLNEYICRQRNQRCHQSKFRSTQSRYCPIGWKGSVEDVASPLSENSAELQLRFSISAVKHFQF